jgi:hypothetical protein
MCSQCQAEVLVSPMLQDTAPGSLTQKSKLVLKSHIGEDEERAIPLTPLWAPAPPPPNLSDSLGDGWKQGTL